MPISVVPPLTPPYQNDIAAMLEKWMPPGAQMAPLALFRSLAKNQNLMEAMGPLGSYFLGSRSPLSPRLREMLILRACAIAGCEYEWGVHVAAFAESVGLDQQEIEYLTSGATFDPRWSEAETIAVHACDELSAAATLNAGTRRKLQNHYGESELLAIIILVSWYRLIASLANSVCDGPEAWAPCFPDSVRSS